MTSRNRARWNDLTQPAIKNLFDGWHSRLGIRAAFVSTIFVILLGVSQVIPDAPSWTTQVTLSFALCSMSVVLIDCIQATRKYDKRFMRRHRKGQS